MAKASKFRAPRVNNTKTSKWAVFAEPMVDINDCEIFGTVFFGFGSYMNSGSIRSHVEVGRYCSIGRNVTLGLAHHNLDGFSTSPFFGHVGSASDMELASDEPKRRVVVGSDCWIGDGVKISSGVTVGHGAVIAAGALVEEDVEPYEIVGGVPAKHIRYRFDQPTRQGLLASSWWDLDPQVLRSIVEPSVAATLDNIAALGDDTPRSTVSHSRLQSEA